MNAFLEMSEYYKILADGLTLQGKNIENTWVDIDHDECIRLSRNIEYRKKPEPEVIYVNKQIGCSIMEADCFNLQKKATLKAQSSGLQYEYIAKRFVECPN